MAKKSIHSCLMHASYWPPKNVTLLISSYLVPGKTSYRCKLLQWDNSDLPHWHLILLTAQPKMFTCNTELTQLYIQHNSLQSVYFHDWELYMELLSQGQSKSLKKAVRHHLWNSQFVSTFLLRQPCNYISTKHCLIFCLICRVLFCK